MYAFAASFETWKDKTLDYEIETGKKITLGLVLFSWKDKTLDYEIETMGCRSPIPSTTSRTWKDKTLDYEIETMPV